MKILVVIETGKSEADDMAAFVLSEMISKSLTDAVSQMQSICDFDSIEFENAEIFQVATGDNPLRDLIESKDKFTEL